MVDITLPLVCEINKGCLREGENFNILDKNRLESAIGNQYAPYPTDEQAIASVYRSLIQNHAFENGNKRTAVLVMLYMAESIDRKMVLTHQELIDLTYKLAMEGGSLISTTSIANKLFGMELEESLYEARQQTALKSNGIYSVLHNEWIKEPVAEDIPELDQEAFDKLFSKWESRYLDVMGSEGAMSDEIVEAQSMKTLYSYVGPVYRFGRYIGDVQLDTMAVSFKQALNNFKFKAARQMGYDRASGANIDIRKELISQDDYDPDEDVITDTEYMYRELCPKCGKTYLNDAGECPICDLGDDSVLDESVGTSLQYRIEEIEDFIEDIYDLRKTSIRDEGEYGIGNLVFKELRNKGYLDNLRELKNKLLSKKLSLE